MPHAGTESSPLTTTEADGGAGAVEAVPVEPVRVDEVRVLDGPNLYFARPAIKVSLHVPGYLDLKRTEAEALARRLGMRSARPGKRGTALRQRFVMRVIRTVTRRVGCRDRRRTARRARARRSDRRGRRARLPVGAPHPWPRRRGAGRRRPGRAARRRRAAPTTVIEAAAAVIMAAPDGPGPSVITPRVPVASVTGTNGKTTTTRLMAHMCMTAGLTTAWSSTDGVVVMGETKEEGDFSGPAGARGVLETPGPRDRHPRDRPRRHAAQGHGRHGQRRQRRHQRQRRPPRAAGHRHPRPARRGQGHRHDRDEAPGLGRAQRRRPARLGHAPRHQGQAVGLQPRPGLAGPVGVDQLRRPRHHRPRRRDRRPLAERRPGPARQDRRRADDAERPVAQQHRQRAGRRGRRPGPRGPALGRRRGPADLRARPRAQLGPAQHLLAAAAERRQGHGHHGHGPQRGRPRGAARGRPRARRAGRRRASRPRLRR